MLGSPNLTSTFSRASSTSCTSSDFLPADVRLISHSVHLSTDPGQFQTSGRESYVCCGYIVQHAFMTKLCMQITKMQIQFRLRIYSSIYIIFLLCQQHKNLNFIVQPYTLEFNLVFCQVLVLLNSFLTISHWYCCCQCFLHEIGISCASCTASVNEVHFVCL